jgi:prepilin-type N-terminal cleavage/methylation domain-containing protein
MYLKLNSDRVKAQSNHSEQGFSLIETMIALTTLGICLAYAMPLFLYAKINNSKSEVRTGALIVSQRVFDKIRSKPFSELPLTDGEARERSSTNIDLTNPAALNDPLVTKAMGRQYQAKVTYCGGLTGSPAVPAVPPPPAVPVTPAVPAVPADPTVCNTTNRKFKVEVSFNGSKVYDLEGTYTDF